MVDRFTGRRFRAAARTLALAALAATAACATTASLPEGMAPAPGGSARAIPQGMPLTRAERTGYRETSTYEDVLAFLDTLQARGAKMARGTIGTTSQGRAIPYVVASRPLVSTPAEAKALHRPIVYVQGNIHGGEVEGKEALQMMLRDLLLSPEPNVLDSIVLIAVPIYNADGNEAWGPQERNRGSQQGPERIGQRANAQGLDLNRDYIKAEAPETRASLAMFNAWNPDLFVDLHTTDGSYHGYALTYSPSLDPAAPLGEYTRQIMLPQVRERVKKRYGFPMYEYGNFSDEDGRTDPASLTKDAWRTYDWHPRFGTNYYGLRNRLSVLSEAFSHDPLDRRVASTYAFVHELLGWTAEHAQSVRTVIDAQDRNGGRMANESGQTMGVALRARFPDRVPSDSIVFEELERTGDSTRTQAGVPKGLRRTGRYRVQNMPVYLNFESSYAWDVPLGFVLRPSDTAAVRLLREHGVTVQQLTKPWSGEVYAFTMDSVITSTRAFQGHHEVRVEGTLWTNRRRQIPAGSWIVDGRQPLGRLALVLLDPMSGDGLVTWNVFDPLKAGDEFPVLQLRHELPGEVQD